MMIRILQLLCSLSMAATAADADLRALTAGVTQIVTPGSPGRVAVFGTNAFAVVMGKAGDTVQPAVGAARLGRGRMVVFGHNGYFGSEALNDPGTRQFMRNVVTWAGAGGNRAVVVAGGKRISDALTAAGIKAAPADMGRLSPATVLIAEADRIQPGQVQAIIAFIQAGGGFISSVTGWGWEQLNPTKELATDLALNHVLRPGGLAIAGNTLSDTAKDGFAVSTSVPVLSSGSAALDALLRSVGGQALGKQDAALAGVTLVGVVESLPPDDKAFLPKLRALESNPRIRSIPSESQPVKSSDAAARVVVSLQANTLRRSQPDQVKAHPAAVHFPGSVPQSAARLKDVKVGVNMKVPNWHSTGLYAAPGEVITVNIPSEAIGNKLRVRIGAHQDRLWHLDSWRRFPEIAHSWPLTRAQTQVANAFGGLVYIEVPSGGSPERIDVTISGAVAAPFYQHGLTSVSEWQQAIRHHAAPWGEIASAKVVVTLPSEVLKSLEDPRALMDVWDRVLDLDAELAAIPKDRPRAERVVCDVQISAGYMHAGYPIMTWMDQTKNFTSKEELMKGNWGIFHEFGHNHQVSDWTFDGTGEVTCNLFSLYVFDKLCGVKPADYGHGRGQAKIINRYHAYFAGGPGTLERWKKDPFTALCMYVQLQDAFGWEPYIKVFAEYQSLSKEDRPRSDQDKRDQWMMRFSRTVGHNLAPFFNKWGVTVTEGAAQSVAHLPAWMPDGMK